MQDEAPLAALDPIEPREEDDARLVARPAETDLDRPRRDSPVGGGGELDRDLAAVVLVDEADQRLADQIRRPRAEQFAKRAVGLLEAAEPVDQRDTDRGVRKKALEAL